VKASSCDFQVAVKKVAKLCLLGYTCRGMNLSHITCVDPVNLAFLDCCHQRSFTASTSRVHKIFGLICCMHEHMGMKLLHPQGGPDVHIFKHMIRLDVNGK
jgi:hypothetical protein